MNQNNLKIISRLTAGFLWVFDFVWLWRRFGFGMAVRFKVMA